MQLMLRLRLRIGISIIEGPLGCSEGIVLLRRGEVGVTRVGRVGKGGV